jgi:signal transduction histidine kinase
LYPSDKSADLMSRGIRVLVARGGGDPLSPGTIEALGSVDGLDVDPVDASTGRGSGPDEGNGATAVDCLVTADPDAPAVSAARARDPPVPVVLVGDERSAGRDGYAAAVPAAVTPAELAAAVREVVDACDENAVVRTLYRTTRDLMRADDRETVAELVVESAESILALPVTGVHLADDEGRLVPAATTAAVSEIFGGDGPVYTPEDEVIWEVYRSREAALIPDAKARGLETPMESGIVLPLGEHGVLVTSSRERGAFDERNLRRVQLLGANATAALDRLERERRLTALHEASRRLMAAPTVTAVAETAVDAAGELLGLDVSGVHRRSSDGEELVPVAVSERVREILGDPPTLGAAPDESVAGRALATGEVQAYDDVRTADAVHDPATPIRSELVFPLDDWGVLVVASTRTGAFDDDAVTAARVFAGNVEAAVQRARREGTLREREAELERQNERLEEFAAVVSHDLRSPLALATGRLDLARDACEDEAVAAELSAVADAHDRMEGLVDDLLTLAREGRTVGDRDRVDLAPLVAAAAEGVSDVTVETAGVDAVDADPERLRELLANLLENAARHGGADVRVEVGPLCAADDGPGEAGTTGEASPGGSPLVGFYVADDGPGIDPGERDSVFEWGYTTGRDGTGLGLAIVRRIAEAHGWSVSATGSAAGGARFEVRTGPGDVVAAGEATADVASRNGDANPPADDASR